MHDPINFTSKDSMYEAAAAILRGEAPTETIVESYIIKHPHIAKMSKQISDFDTEELEDLLFMIEAKFRHIDFDSVFDNEDAFIKVADKLKMAAHTFKASL